MKIVIYGGSFNPVHFGHIGLAQWVVEHTNIDEVWLMVSPNNPLKSSSELAPAVERLASVQKAIEGIHGLKASDFEFHLPLPSYTANTLRELTTTYPEHQFTLLIGEDNWQLFTHWREWEYILANYPIFVYPRHGETNSTPPSAQGDITILRDAPYFDISSTKIRAERRVNEM